MKHISSSLFLICVAVVNVAAWVGHEVAIQHIHDIVFYYHPLPEYIPKSKEELMEQIRGEEIDRYGYVLDELFVQFGGSPSSSEEKAVVMALTNMKNKSEFNLAHFEKHRESVESRVEYFF